MHRLHIVVVACRPRRGQAYKGLTPSDLTRIEEKSSGPLSQDDHDLLLVRNFQVSGSYPEAPAKKIVILPVE